VFPALGRALYIQVSMQAPEEARSSCPGSGVSSVHHSAFEDIIGRSIQSPIYP